MHTHLPPTTNEVGDALARQCAPYRTQPPVLNNTRAASAISTIGHRIRAARVLQSFHLDEQVRGALNAWDVCNEQLTLT
jgi:hypothetical protein